MHIVGYTADADTWCPDCAEDVYGPLSDDSEDSEGNYVHPIFDTSDAGDAPTHCGRCGAFIDDSWTAETVRYAENAVREYLNTGRGAVDILRVWVDNGYPWAGFDTDLAETFLAQLARIDADAI